MSKSDEIKARAERYNKAETTADSLGRIISVRRLKPSERTRVEEMTPGLSGTEIVVDGATGEQIEISRRFQMILAASVCAVDDIPITFPKSRPELDSMLDKLDEEGLAAAIQAFIKLNPPKPKAEEGAAGAEVAQIGDDLKNG